MFDCTFLDKFGNKLEVLTQWDINQTIYIKDSGFTIAPQFHFCNRRSEIALVVPSELKNDGTIVVPIPNQLIIEPYMITVYVYLLEDNHGKTIDVIKLPVRQRPQPDNFVYEENI